VQHRDDRIFCVGRNYAEISVKFPMMKVTFDTNTFDKAARPHVYAKAPDHGSFVKIHEALKVGHLAGFLCDTIVTLEGIKVDDRAEVFGSTTLAANMVQENPETIHINLRTEQPLRAPVHPKQAERFSAALAMGMKFLGTPRVGMPRVEVLNVNPYVEESEEQLIKRLDRFFKLAKAIEDRGLGSIQAQQLAQRLANASQTMPTPWFKALGDARDVHETREVARAIAEWADGDSIAAHYGYGNDFFCTGDEARRGHVSILDAVNRAWLTTDFGIRFSTLRELAALS
jgi:hypothetical protein